MRRMLFFALLLGVFQSVFSVELDDLAAALKQLQLRIGEVAVPMAREEVIAKRKEELQKQIELYEKKEDKTAKESMELLYNLLALSARDVLELVSKLFAFSIKGQKKLAESVKRMPNLSDLIIIIGDLIVKLTDEEYGKKLKSLNKVLHCVKIEKNRRERFTDRKTGDYICKDVGCLDETVDCYKKLFSDLIFVLEPINEAFLAGKKVGEVQVPGMVILISEVFDPEFSNKFVDPIVDRLKMIFSLIDQINKALVKVEKKELVAVV